MGPPPDEDPAAPLGLLPTLVPGEGEEVEEEEEGGRGEGTDAEELLLGVPRLRAEPRRTRCEDTGRSREEENCKRQIKIVRIK